MSALPTEGPRIVDLSMTIAPHWRFGTETTNGRTPTPRFTFESSAVSIGSHAFTHVDAESHIVGNAPTLDDHVITDFIGAASLIDLVDVADETALDAALLAPRTEHVRPGEIVLLRTALETRHPTNTPEYWTRAPWVTASGAEHLASLGVRATAFDFPQDRGIRRDYDDAFIPSDDPTEDWACHMLLLGRGILQFEYLTHTEAIRSTHFTFFGAPLRLDRGNGSPIRCFVIEGD